MQSTLMQEGVELYDAEKPVDDIDLIEVVRNILTKAGLTPKLSECFDNDRFVLEAQGKESSVQRFLMNRYWNNQLIMSGQPCADERYSLIPNGQVTDWIELFNAKIVPFLLANDLPRNHGS